MKGQRTPSPLVQSQSKESGLSKGPASSELDARGFGYDVDVFVATAAETD